jgi:hypothetical protein
VSSRAGFPALALARQGAIWRAGCRSGSLALPGDRSARRVYDASMALHPVADPGQFCGKRAEPAARAGCRNGWRAAGGPEALR